MPGFYVRPGTETLVSLRATRTSTNHEALSFFSPEQRMCYTEQEFQPLYYNKVSSRDIELWSHANLTNRQLGSATV